MGDVVMVVWDLLVPKKKCTRSSYYPLLTSLKIFILHEIITCNDRDLVWLKKQIEKLFV